MAAFDPLRTIDNSPNKGVMKTTLLIVGVLGVLVGLLWIGQGVGLVRWPASSFMIDQRPWISRGSVLALVGLISFLFSRRR